MAGEGFVFGWIYAFSGMADPLQNGPFDAAATVKGEGALSVPPPAPLAAWLPSLLLVAPALAAIGFLYPLPFRAGWLDPDPSASRLRAVVARSGLYHRHSLGVFAADHARFDCDCGISEIGHHRLGDQCFALAVSMAAVHPLSCGKPNHARLLASNGMMNNVLVDIGVMHQASAQSLLDWRGLVPTLAWKQTPFVTVLLVGAMASFDRSTKEAAHNLGAGRLRCLIQIMLPQVLGALRVSLVTIMSVLSGPMMLISGDSIDGGAPQDYALVQEILAALSCPIFMVPGNHEQRSSMRHPYASEPFYAVILRLQVQG